MNKVLNYIANVYYSLRQESLRLLFGETRDYNHECGYPPTLEITDYRNFYNRWGIARRIVDAWPKESWQVQPLIFETSDPEQSEFEKAIDDLTRDALLFHFLARIDILSGIGRFGILLLGIDDKLPLDQPAMSALDRKLLYLRALDESYVTIESREEDVSNSRFSQPTIYTLNLTNADGEGTSSVRVHWSRIIHIADNREMDEVYGVPRLQSTYNHVHDIRKIASGSAEMFWKGGFPGYGINVDPKLEATQEIELDTEGMKDEMEKYFNSLQRYAVTRGAQMTSLAPQVADPRGHFEVLLTLTCIAIEMPKRIFLGTEAAKLASTQDKKTWESRLRFRQENYLTPLVVRPTIDRLIELGCIPQPKEASYTVEWPNIEAPSEDAQVKNAKDRTEAIAKYVMSGADELIPPRLYFSLFHKFTNDEIEAIESELLKSRKDADENNDLEPSTGTE